MPEGVYRFARCGQCSTLYVDSDVSEGYLKSVYQDEKVDIVEEKVGHAGVVKHFAARRAEFERHWRLIRSARPPAQGDRLLDIGCQTGDFGVVSMRDGVVPFGVELSQYHAEEARRAWGAPSEVFCDTVGAVAGLGLKFQYITAFETLEHVLDPIGVLAHCRSMLSDDGMLAVSVPSSDYFHLKFRLLRDSCASGVLDRCSGLLGRHVGGPVLPHTHIYNFSSQSVRMLAGKAGFRVVAHEITGWGGRLRSWLAPITSVVFSLSGGLAIAPSHLILARKV